MLRINAIICYIFINTLFSLIQFQRLWRRKYYLRKLVIPKLKYREYTGKGAFVPLEILKPSFQPKYRVGYELKPNPFY
ncbi:hypothetical protein CPAV1605_205 [seawater metagenome]|uniref:Uncharacterized protein n=1 Tax=seawater metagenome TaxID=1561972 RepID=A0A5E8CGB3_9ZZZZ